MTGERCVASHYAHDCSDPEQCRTWLALMLANVERRERRADLEREEQAVAQVARARASRVVRSALDAPTRPFWSYPPVVDSIPATGDRRVA